MLCPSCVLQKVLSVLSSVCLLKLHTKWIVVQQNMEFLATDLTTRLRDILIPCVILSGWDSSVGRPSDFGLRGWELESSRPDSGVGQVTLAAP